MNPAQPWRLREGEFGGHPSSSCEPAKQGALGRIIQRFRKEKGISQEKLAKNVGLDRTTIARIECGKFKFLSVLKLTAIAQTFGIDLNALLLESESAGESLTYRSHADHIEFLLDYPEDGFRILSLLPKRKEFFFGRIEIGPQKTILSAKLPHPDQVYLHCLEGKMILVRQAKEFLLKPGDSFAFSAFSDYEFYNPDQLKPTSSLFITYPSFLAL